MKIKKIISLCKANKHISLYDMTTQMLGDGLAAYYLNDCPVFSIDSLMISHRRRRTKSCSGTPPSRRKRF